ncbi:unnamed protein product, partial [Rotaria socialis]
DDIATNYVSNTSSNPTNTSDYSYHHHQPQHFHHHHQPQTLYQHHHGSHYDISSNNGYYHQQPMLNEHVYTYFDHHFDQFDVVAVVVPAVAVAV